MPRIMVRPQIITLESKMRSILAATVLMFSLSSFAASLEAVCVFDGIKAEIKKTITGKTKIALTENKKTTVVEVADSSYSYRTGPTPDENGNYQFIGFSRTFFTKDQETVLSYFVKIEKGEPLEFGYLLPASFNKSNDENIQGHCVLLK
jgi:hypothetical protein